MIALTELASYQASDSKESVLKEFGEVSSWQPQSDHLLMASRTELELT
ncbi:hypothetical protein SynMITS9220_00902 [Synechococcus sp. MIT S9220]|nr:hypothetical protein SynMITS9220_00902 [Synechococcus sp. MIT S9220]